MIERAEHDRKLQTKPCWSWSGAEALNFSEQTDLRPLLAMLAAKQSSDDQILAFLVDLRARFQRWLHQDEFGFYGFLVITASFAVMRAGRNRSRFCCRTRAPNSYLSIRPTMSKSAVMSPATVGSSIANSRRQAAKRLPLSFRNSLRHRWVCLPNTRWTVQFTLYAPIGGIWTKCWQPAVAPTANSRI